MAPTPKRRNSLAFLFLCSSETLLSQAWGFSLTHNHSIRPVAPQTEPPFWTTTTRSSRTSLHASKKKSSSKGVYSRPSAAIERGSGFFVPGLEGAKVRLVGGVLLLALTVVNHGGSDDLTSSLGNNFAEGLAAVFGCLVLLQAAIEFTKETKSSNDDAAVLIGDPSSSSIDSRPGTMTLQQVWSIPPIDEAWKARVEWSASSYLALTPSTDVLLLGPGKVVYSLGRRRDLFLSDDENAATMAALETLSKSTSGRVSLPMTHPTIQGIANDSRTSARCAVLQRVGNEDDDNGNSTTQLCWLVLSDQLLASFTKQDLRWLGRLAVYVEP